MRRPVKRTLAVAATAAALVVGTAMPATAASEQRCGPLINTGTIGTAQVCVTVYWSTSGPGVYVNPVVAQIYGDADASGFDNIDGYILDDRGNRDANFVARYGTGRKVTFDAGWRVDPQPGWVNIDYDILGDGSQLNRKVAFCFAGTGCLN